MPVLDRVRSFNTKLAAQTDDMGVTFTKAGNCSRCRSSVHLADGDEPDPRGFAGPRHSAATIERFPKILFCWNCLNERGSEGHDECERIALRLTGENQ